VQSGWARWWHRLQPVRVQREQNASDTRAKRGRNAKNNARITRTNAGRWHRLQPVRAAYALYFRELLPDRERNSENYYPALVNSELAFRPAVSPARQPRPPARGSKRMDFQRSSMSICGPIGFFLSFSGRGLYSGRYTTPERWLCFFGPDHHGLASMVFSFAVFASCEKKKDFTVRQTPVGHSFSRKLPHVCASKRRAGFSPRGVCATLVGPAFEAPAGLRPLARRGRRPESRRQR
jgi:hypothetical protein